MGMDADIDCVILDCGHLVSCNQSGKKLTERPICRQQVLEVLSVANVTEQDMMKLTTKQIKQVLNLWSRIQGQGVREEESGGERDAGEGAEVQGVHGEGGRLCLHQLWPFDDLHLLW